MSNVASIGEARISFLFFPCSDLEYELSFCVDFSFFDHVLSEA